MLVISRKPTESIQVGETKVVVLEAKSGRVNLGFEGPATVPIWRSEIPVDIPTRVPSEHAMFAAKLMYSLRLFLLKKRHPDPIGKEWVNLHGVPVDWLEQAEQVCKDYERFLYEEE